MLTSELRLLRIDPILIATVCITEDVESLSKREDSRLERFLAKLTNGKPVEYYRQHIKHLAILGSTSFSENETTTTTLNRILAICTGVEYFALLTPPPHDLDLFNPQQHQWSHLRRLGIKLSAFKSRPSESSDPIFHNNPCFANLTHLHISDEAYTWPTYTGWETLTTLTHIAFSSALPLDVARIMLILPSIQYVAVGHYVVSEWLMHAMEGSSIGLYSRAKWGPRVVLFPGMCDWERGARGEDDFWGLVEREVDRRLGWLVD